MGTDQTEKLNALLKNSKRTYDIFSKKTGRVLKSMSQNLEDVEKELAKTEAKIVREEKKLIDEMDAEVLKLFEP
mgnify:CR=1 FL=1